MARTAVQLAAASLGLRRMSASPDPFDQEEPVTIFTYTCRSCGATREVTRIELEAARRGLEQFADDDAELAELLASGDTQIAASFEFCPGCRALEQVVDFKRGGSLGTPRADLHLRSECQRRE